MAGRCSRTLAVLRRTLQRENVTRNLCEANVVHPMCFPKRPFPVRGYLRISTNPNPMRRQRRGARGAGRGFERSGSGFREVRLGLSGSHNWCSPGRLMRPAMMVRLDGMFRSFTCWKKDRSPRHATIRRLLLLEILWTCLKRSRRR